jgi:hypothetical protein
MRIQNHHKTIPVALALAAIFSVNTAQAKGFSTDNSNLPDASNIYRAPLKVQIVDPSPQVTDFRKPKQTTIYQINVPPMPQNTTNVVQIGDGAAGARNSPGNSNTVPILQNPLPFAGPHSNITPQQSAANQLPSGTSTKGLTGILARKPFGQSVPMAKMPVAKALPAPQPTPVKSYSPTSTSSAVSQTNSVSTHVTPLLLHHKD